jgi:hypothetical protein
MNGVSDDGLSATGNRGSKLDGSGIRFSVFHRACRNFPLQPAVQVLDDTNFHSFVLMIAHLNLEEFIDPAVAGIEFESGLSAFSHQIKSVAGVEPDCFIFWRVVDLILADELVTPVHIPPVDFHLAFWKRHAQVGPL